MTTAAQAPFMCMPQPCTAERNHTPAQDGAGRIYCTTCGEIAPPNDSTDITAMLRLEGWGRECCIGDVFGYLCSG